MSDQKVSHDALHEIGICDCALGEAGLQSRAQEMVAGAVQRIAQSQIRLGKRAAAQLAEKERVQKEMAESSLTQQKEAQRINAEWVKRAMAAEQRLQEAQAWKESQLKITPDWQKIGELLNVGLGQSVTENIIPAITDLRERLRQREAELEQRDGKIGRAYEVAHEHARTKPHETVPVQVWADIDTGIADLVRYLNTIDGVRTDASCQGTKGYSPYVMATWNAETDARLRAEFEIETLGENWGYIRVKRVQP